VPPSANGYGCSYGSDINYTTAGAGAEFVAHTGSFGPAQHNPAAYQRGLVLIEPISTYGDGDIIPEAGARLLGAEEQWRPPRPTSSPSAAHDHHRRSQPRAANEHHRRPSAAAKERSRAHHDGPRPSAGQQRKGREASLIVDDYYNSEDDASTVLQRRAVLHPSARHRVDRVSKTIKEAEARLGYPQHYYSDSQL